MSVPRILTTEGGSSIAVLAEKFEVFLFDLDGVVYVGDELLPGAGEALSRLRTSGKAIRFLTNDPRPTREELARKLCGLGVQARIEEIVSSGWATGRYLAQSHARSAYVVGSPGLAHELREAGVEVTEEHSGAYSGEPGVGEEPDVVVVGADKRVGYSCIERAARLIRAGSNFVATNPDGSLPSPDGPKPAAGAFVAAIAVAAGREPEATVGKPHRPMFEAALAGSSSELGRVTMIGDSPETDIYGARRLGLFSILISAESRVPLMAGGASSPDAVMPDLSALFDPKTG